jgi:hypothetical protein
MEQRDKEITQFRREEMQDEEEKFTLAVGNGDCCELMLAKRRAVAEVDKKSGCVSLIIDSCVQVAFDRGPANWGGGGNQRIHRLSHTDQWG